MVCKYLSMLGLKLTNVSMRGPWDPFHKRFFHHNSNSMEISFSCNSITGDHIPTKFGTYHDNPAVVPCAKYCSDHFISIWMRAKWNWNCDGKLLVKWAPGPNVLKTQQHIILNEYTQITLSSTKTIVVFILWICFLLNHYHCSAFRHASRSFIKQTDIEFK